jgi:hypothetical protein
VGTQADNMKDKADKGRGKGIGAGEANGRAKLTVEQVLEIRASTEGSSAAGRRYGVSPTTIRNIRIGKLWKEIVNHCNNQNLEDCSP